MFLDGIRPPRIGPAAKGALPLVGNLRCQRKPFTPIIACLAHRIKPDFDTECIRDGFLWKGNPYPVAIPPTGADFYKTGRLRQQQPARFPCGFFFCACETPKGNPLFCRALPNALRLFHIQQLRRAMRAAGCVDCNFRLAIRALLRRCRGGRLLFFMGQGGQLVHPLEQAEQHKRHNQEIHHSGEEAGREACNVLQGVCRAARDQVQNRVDKIIRQGGDDPGKRTAMSITFPRSAKVLNSCINFFIAPDSLLLDFLHYNTGRLSGKGDGADFVER